MKDIFVLNEAGWIWVRVEKHLISEHSIVCTYDRLWASCLK